MTAHLVATLPRCVSEHNRTRLRTLLLGTLASLPLVTGPALAQAPAAAPPGPQVAATAPPPATMAPTAPMPTGSAPLAGTPPVTDAAIAPPATPAPPPPPPSAETLLLEQADFWRAQGQPDKATDSLRRLLDVNANNTDALGLLAQIDAEQGKGQEAQDYFDRLLKINPNDPRIADIRDSLTRGPIDQDALAQARLLRSQNNLPGAIAAFQKAFHGTTPVPSLAVEYYTAYGQVGVIQFFAARRAVAAIVAKNPNDLANQLAYARLLVTRELSRQDGIDRLSELAKLPGISASAKTAWREALLWQGPDTIAYRELEEYQRRYPVDTANDPQFQAQLKLFRQTLPSDSDQMLVAGFNALKDKNLTQAGQDFDQAVALDQNSIWAITMVALMRKVQGRNQESHDLIERAIAIDPTQKDKILATLGGDPSIVTPTPGGKGGAVWTAADQARAARAGARNARLQYDRIAALSRSGHSAQAERLLAGLLHGRTAGNLQMADLQLQAGQGAAAEANFRIALRHNPRNADALVGLSRAEQLQGKSDAASESLAQARSIYESTGNRRGLASLAAGQTNDRDAALRAQAEKAADPVDQERLYRQAIATEPTDPWARLGLAKILVSQRNRTEADTVMAPVELQTTPAALQASIYFAQVKDDNEQAADLIAKLPPRARTPEMRALQTQVAFRQEVGGIVRGSDNPADKRERLLALSQQPDPTGTRGDAIGRALIKIGAEKFAPVALQNSLAATASPTDPQRLAYSGVLLAASDPNGAKAMTQTIDTTNLTSEQRTSLVNVDNAVAVMQSDRLNNAGKPATAYDHLAPRLARNPDDVNLRLALSRLYQSNGQPKQALAISSSVLKDDQQDIDVRVSTINAATASGNLGLADTLAKQGMAQAPDDPRIFVAAAGVAQARGANGAAVRYLKTARELRSRQLQAANGGS